MESYIFSECFPKCMQSSPSLNNPNFNKWYFVMENFVLKFYNSAPEATTASML